MNYEMLELSEDFQKKQDDDSIKILVENIDNIENQNFTVYTASTKDSFNFSEEFIKKKRERKKKRKKRQLLIDEEKIIKIDEMREKKNEK